MVRGQWVWIGVFVALAGCGGRSVSDGAVTSGGSSAGGSSAVGGMSAGGTTSSSGATATSCLDSGDTPPYSPVVFSFESSQSLWVRLGCGGIDYALSKDCKDASVSIQTLFFCGQECGSNDNGCPECGACADGATELGQFGPGGANAATQWDGYAYTGHASGAGCSCYSRLPARSGTYTISITGFLSNDDASAQKNGYPFTTTFDYPPPDGVVHVDMNFKGI